MRLQESHPWNRQLLSFLYLQIQGSDALCETEACTMKTKTDRFYKVLDESGKAFHGGSGIWSLPVGRKYGAWMPPIEGDLEPCVRGYHLCREQDLVKWLGPAIYVAEAGKERIVHENNKVVVREARLLRKTAWDEKIARLFAADCAEHVLTNIKESSIREFAEKAIRASRAYANGEIDDDVLSAAESAAWS